MADGASVVRRKEANVIQDSKIAEWARKNADRITEAAERQLFDLDNPGFCVGCGEEAYGVEPDARRYTCESCGEPKVFGAEELLFYI